MKEKLLDLLVELCEDEGIRKKLDEDLFESDLLDSLTFAELLIGIEEKFGIIIAPSAVDREDINTPNKIIRLVEERIKQ